MHQKIRDQSHLVKDQDTGAILNTDADGLQRRRIERERARILGELPARVATLEEDFQELKFLFLELLEKMNGSSPEQ